MQRIFASYKLMLDFYGMRLENETTGLISRSKNYAALYKNLCSTFYPDPRSWMDHRGSSHALREPLPSRNLILSVRSLRVLGDESMVG